MLGCWCFEDMRADDWCDDRFREMVSLIPRLSSFAVSGTPARSLVAGLIHVWKRVVVGHRVF